MIGGEGRIGPEENHPRVGKMLSYHPDDFDDALPPEGRETLNVDLVGVPSRSLERCQLSREFGRQASKPPPVEWDTVTCQHLHTAATWGGVWLGREGVE